MDDMPVTNQSEGKQQEGDQQQAGSFRGINGVPGMLVGIVLALVIRHGFIVRRPETAGAVYSCVARASRGLVLHYARRRSCTRIFYSDLLFGLVLIHARFSRQLRRNRAVWRVRG